RRVHPDMALDAGPSPLGQRLGEDPLVSAVALLVQVVDVDADRDLVGAGTAGADGVEHQTRRPARGAGSGRLAAFGGRDPGGIGEAGQLPGRDRPEVLQVDVVTEPSLVDHLGEPGVRPEAAEATL